MLGSENQWQALSKIWEPAALFLDRGYEHEWEIPRECLIPTVKGLSMALLWFAGNEPEVSELILPPEGTIGKSPYRDYGATLRLPEDSVNTVNEIIPKYGIEKPSIARFAFVYHAFSSAKMEEIEEYYEASIVKIRYHLDGELARHLNSRCDESRTPTEYMTELLRADMKAKRNT